MKVIVRALAVWAKFSRFGSQTGHIFVQIESFLLVWIIRQSVDLLLMWFVDSWAILYNRNPQPDYHYNIDFFSSTGCLYSKSNDIFQSIESNSDSRGIFHNRNPQRNYIATTTGFFLYPGSWYSKSNDIFQMIESSRQRCCLIQKNINKRIRVIKCY